MAKKKKSEVSYKKLLLSQVKQKYQFIVIGLAVIISGYFLLSSSFPGKKLLLKKITPANKTGETPSIKTMTYVTKPGDYLWKIAEEAYGSGYNAYDIAVANKITDPNTIYSNTKLILPSVSPKTPTKGEIATAMTEQVVLEDTKYTVQPGDHLWKIALGAYGDGYAWVRIAEANNLLTPDVINPGTVLTIPR